MQPYAFALPGAYVLALLQLLICLPAQERGVAEEAAALGHTWLGQACTDGRLPL
jgi:hypothetical protein